MGLALAVGLLGLSIAGEAAAFCRLSTGRPEPGSGGTCEEEGRLLTWQDQCISYSVVARARAPLGLDEMRDTIDRSFETWLEQACDGRPLPFDVRQTEELSLCTEAEHNERGGNVNTIAFLDDWLERELPEEAFGLTLVWHDRNTGRIVGADMLLNDDSMGRFANCGGNGCAQGQIDLQNVVTHEAGHFLGLGHSAWRNAAMYWQARAGEVKKRQLDADDQAGLCSLYGRQKAPKTCTSRDFGPPGGFEPTCDGQTPSGCACRLAAPGHGGEAARPGLIPWLCLGLLGAWRRMRAPSRHSRHRRPTR